MSNPIVRIPFVPPVLGLVLSIAREYVPSSTRRLGLVSLEDAPNFSSYWPATLTQLVGGDTWSISFVRLNGSEPVSIDPAPEEPVIVNVNVNDDPVPFTDLLPENPEDPENGDPDVTRF